MLQRAKKVNRDRLLNVIIYDDEGHGLSKEEHIKETYQKIVKLTNEIKGDKRYVIMSVSNRKISKDLYISISRHTKPVHQKTKRWFYGYTE